MENYYHSGCHSYAHSPFPVPPHVSASLQFSEFHSWSEPIEGASEERRISASKSHSQAEKRRRDRINAQLATLRKLIPKSDKVNKF